MLGEIIKQLHDLRDEFYDVGDVLELSEDIPPHERGYCISDFQDLVREITYFIESLEDVEYNRGVKLEG